MKKIVSLIFLFFPLFVFCQELRVAEDCPLHEAFVSCEYSDLSFEWAPLAPPPKVDERRPRQTDEGTIWIPGYWSWNDRWKDFVWISGTWRRSPPNHQWIEGEWKRIDDQWKRVPGFWSPVSELSYLSEPPPEKIQEQVSLPPESDLFWMSGYWAPGPGGYQWVEGSWEPFDPNWVFNPASYVPRFEGAVFIPSYWDFPVDQRGTCYPPVWVPKGVREHLVYLPSRPCAMSDVLKRSFSDYPSYQSFIHHSYHFRTSFWDDWCCTPPWWVWDTWWAFTPSNQWALWRWYTHPGASQPPWITSELAEFFIEGWEEEPISRSEQRRMPTMDDVLPLPRPVLRPSLPEKPIRVLPGYPRGRSPRAVPRRPTSPPREWIREPESEGKKVLERAPAYRERRKPQVIDRFAERRHD